MDCNYFVLFLYSCKDQDHTSNVKQLPKTELFDHNFDCILSAKIAFIIEHFFTRPWHLKLSSTFQQAFVMGISCSAMWHSCFLWQQIWLLWQQINCNIYYSKLDPRQKCHDAYHSGLQIPDKALTSRGH